MTNDDDKVSEVDAVLAAAERVCSDGILPLRDLRAEVQGRGGAWLVDLLPRDGNMLGGNVEVHVDASSREVISIVYGQ